MKYRLPLITERAVRESEAVRQTLAQDFEAKLMAQVAGHGAITCKKGCDSCCYYPILLNLLEGVTLFRWLVEHGLWGKSLQDKFKATHKRVWGLSPSVWMLSMTPCPLLTEERACAAYEGRPFVCRTTVSTGDAYYCHPHRFADGMSGLVSRRELDEKLQETDPRLLKAANMPGLRVPLATAVLVGERLCKDGLAPEEATQQLFLEWAMEC